MAKQNTRDDTPPPPTPRADGEQLSDIILILDKKELQLRAVSEIDENGNHQSVPADKKHQNSFLKLDRFSNIFESFLRNFWSQAKEPTHTGLILHSDRGVQYTCSEFTELLAKNKMVRSNSRKGDCWDNAVAESFFKTLKCELIYQFKQLLPGETMRTELFNYIESWYNRRRRHSALGNLTITEFYNRIINQNLKTAA